MSLFQSMLQYLRSTPGATLARDAVDVALVWFVTYRALLVLRGTRAMQVAVGMAAVFVLYLVAQALQLVTVLSLVSTVVSSLLLIAVVVFQADIRRGLMRLGSNAWFGSARTQESRVIEEVVEAATELARHRVGAIIAFEQEANLDEFVGANKGKDLDAVVSSELLVSLFVPEGMNKLHDGAVIVRDLRIAKAGVFFPMPDQRALDQSFGSRHRAALGISEETDAVVVVVSEERGTISFIFNGNIASNLDGPKLKTMLEAIFSPKGRGKKPKPPARPAQRRTEAPHVPEPSDSKREGPRSDAPTGLRISMPNEEPDGPPPSRRMLRSISEVEPAPAPLRPRPVVDPNETGRLPPVLAPITADVALDPREGRRPITLKSGKSPAADKPRDSASDEPEREP